MKHKFQALILLGILILFVPLCGNLQYADRWYENTIINGIDCSGLTLEETVSMLDGSDYTLTILGREDGSDEISGDDISLQTDAAVQLEALFEEQHASSFFPALFRETTLSFTPEVTYDAEALLAAFESSRLVTGSDDYEIVSPSAAAVVWDGTAFVVKDHVEGNTLIVEEAMEYVCAAVEALASSVDLSAQDVYETVEVEINVDQLQALCLEANGYALHWITWDMGNDVTETLTPDDLNEWVTIENGEVSFDEDALYDWIEDFCLTYKTVGKDREFTTHDGEVITISGGDYGWRLDYSSICEEVADIVLSSDEDAVSAYLADPTEETAEALSVELEPDWKQTAYQLDYETFNYDWDPDNYSEVDISEQMVYVYKDGELAYSCICVTGLPNGTRDTDQGIWYIKDKKTSYTMTSETYGYTTPTKYWIRITWSGIGYHYMARSDWGSWSSSLYKSAGSHGCVNLQYSDAEAIYSLVSLYDAVIIHE